jgi:YaiO family outer membrane protein
MIDKLIPHLILGVAIGAALPASVMAQAEPAGQPEPFVPSGSIDAGMGYHSLSDGYRNWNTQFVRGVYASDPKNTWNLEINNQNQFGARGVAMAVGNTHVFNDDWYTSAFVSASAGGFFLPKYGVDIMVNRKLLPARNLVVGVGLSTNRNKDRHRDTAVLLSGAYYFDAPLVIEGNVRLNNSNPGSVRTNYVTLAATYGREKQRYLVISHARGREGWQTVGDPVTGTSTTLTDFRSHSTLLTWREWIGRDWGMQLRAEHYNSAYYRRWGGEMGVFFDF